VGPIFVLAINLVCAYYIDMKNFFICGRKNFKGYEVALSGNNVIIWITGEESPERVKEITTAVLLYLENEGFGDLSRMKVRVELKEFGESGGILVPA
jgi:hypothetical protein